MDVLIREHEREWKECGVRGAVARGGPDVRRWQRSGATLKLSEARRSVMAAERDAARRHERRRRPPRNYCGVRAADRPTDRRLR
jgi:hypothetical protein